MTPENRYTYNFYGQWSYFIAIGGSAKDFLFRYAKVHSMHLGSKTSGVELAFPSVWRRGYCLNYNLWRVAKPWVTFSKDFSQHKHYFHFLSFL